MPPNPKPERPPITGLILAGGEGRRMAGQDKGLVMAWDRPLIDWLIERLSPQVVRLMISANRSLEQYRAYGHPVLQDPADAPTRGPLLGLATGLQACETDWLLAVPCDMPGIPFDLGARLLDHALATGRRLVCPVVSAPQTDPAQTGQSADLAPRPRRQAAIMLVHRSLLPSLQASLAAGQARVMAWQDAQRLAELALEAPADAFANLNTPEALNAWHPST